MPENQITDESKAGGNLPELSQSGSSKDRVFPIVGIGASAGGLEALKAFFSNVAENAGMAYMVVIHMSPKQPSMLPELLQRTTRIPVTTALDAELIQPDHVYVIPPDKDLSVFNGAIQLLEVTKRHIPLPIDFFLRSLAKDQQANAVAVILSGTGADGTLGVKEIKACDGLALAQSEESAGYSGMPASAISTGVVDFILPPEEMPEKLVQYFENFGTLIRKKPTDSSQEDKNWLNKVFALLRAQVGHDFSLYKKNTIVRRINRRMSVNQIGNPETYIRFLREDPKEAEALFRELLIGVTNFFRDPASFETLQKDILPGMLGAMEDDALFRVWVAGCSTGEEVYSLAMVFHECMDGVSKRIGLQIFGTDIDKYAIEKARDGLFPDSIVADVDPQRLTRFFSKEGQSFRIRKEIRDSIVFSVQDVLKDPPFSRLSLLCCRNLLIYLDSAAQKKLLPLFHYTLAPGGILMLGSSESLGEFTSLFHTMENKWKIFQRREVPRGLLKPVEFPSGLDAAPAGVPENVLPAGSPGKVDLGQLARREVLERFSPPAVLVDAQGMILYIVGRTGKYLESSSGPPTLSVLDMAREGLRIELSSAMRAAVSSVVQVTRKKISVKTNGDYETINLHVLPLKAPGDPAVRFLVVFEEAPLPSPKPAERREAPGGEEGHRIGELEKELQNNRESHQTTIEELESSNEELKSTCEELQSSNEELQSTNEELESAKEELQSVNEELQTVNAELQSKLEELSTAHDDLRNLLNSTEVATIFVDNNMRVKRFTQEATKIANFIASDIGRPLNHLVTNLNYEQLSADLSAVLERLTPRESEVRTLDGKWYGMRIMPYRTTDNRIDGAVLTFSNIDDQKRAQEMLKAGNLQMEQARLLVRSVFDMNPDPLAVIDPQGKIVIANTAFGALMHVGEDKIPGCNVLDLEDGGPEQTAMKNALDKGGDFFDIPVRIDRPAGKKYFVARGQKMPPREDQPVGILLHFEEDPTKGHEDGN